MTAMLRNSRQMEDFMQDLMKDIYAMQEQGIDPLYQTAYLAKRVFTAPPLREGEEAAFTTSQLRRIFFLAGEHTVVKRGERG